MSDYLEEKITEDIINHTLTRIHTIMQDSVDLVPDGREPKLLLVVTMELLMGTCNSFAENDYFPIFQQLTMAQKILTISAMLVKTLPEADRPVRTAAQYASDTIAAMRELHGLFNFKVEKA